MASITREDRPGKPWRVSWREDGRQRTRRFRLKAEALDFCAQREREARAPDPVDTVTLAEWAEEWVRTSGHEWTDRTLTERSATLEKWVLPHLGGRLVAALGRRDIRRWRADLIASGVTAHRVNRCVSILSACLGGAVDADLTVGNAAAGVKAVPYRRQPQDPATILEVETMRAWMNRPQDRVAVTLMGYCGLRPGEVVALEWGDVLDGSVVVRRAGGRVDERTKSGNTRTVPMVGPVKEDVEAARLVTGGGRLVVGVTHFPGWSRRVWRTTRVRAGVDRAPKVLRHTAASLWIEEGRSPFEVAYLLGHTTARLVLERYGHMFADRQVTGDTRDVEEAVQVVRRRVLTHRWWFLRLAAGGVPG